MLTVPTAGQQVALVVDIAAPEAAVRVAVVREIKTIKHIVDYVFKFII